LTMSGNAQGIERQQELMSSG